MASTTDPLLIEGVDNVAIGFLREVVEEEEVEDGGEGEEGGNRISRKPGKFC